MYYFLSFSALTALGFAGGQSWWIKGPLLLVTFVLGFIFMGLGAFKYALPAMSGADDGDEDGPVDQMINEMLLATVRSYAFFFAVAFILGAALTTLPFYLFAPKGVMWAWLAYLMLPWLAFYLASYHIQRNGPFIITYVLALLSAPLVLLGILLAFCLREAALRLHMKYENNRLLYALWERAEELFDRIRLD